MNVTQLQESLYLQKRHICSDEAKYYLFPPNRGTDGRVRCGGGGVAVSYEVEIRPIDTWHIDIGDGGVLIPAKFCPFCGEQLKTE